LLFLVEVTGLVADDLRHKAGQAASGVRLE
jgi:hypothetical protein